LFKNCSVHELIKTNHHTETQSLQTVAEEIYEVAQNKPDYSTFQPSLRKFA